MKTTSAYRFAVGASLATAFVLVWVIGAVGLIGAEGDPADLMYAGVLAVGVTGAMIARFQPRGRYAPWSQRRSLRRWSP